MSLEIERALADILSRLDALEGLQRPDQDTSTLSNVTFGDVNFSGTFLQNSNFIDGYSDTLASGAEFVMGNFRGLILVSNATDNILELIIVRASGAAIASVVQSGLICTLGVGGSTIAVYFSSSNWRVRNDYAVSKIIRVQVFAN